MNILLSSLCSVGGISGREGAVRDRIIEEIKDVCTYKIDALGNLITFKQGAARPACKLMLAAHMDEVGFVVHHITDDGFLKVLCVGGVEPSVLAGARVLVGTQSIPGVVSTLPVHLLSKDEKEIPLKHEQLTVDIGARDKADALEHVQLFDAVTFMPHYEETDGMFSAKALDDRAGVAVLIDLIRRNLPFDLHFVFTVQEEIGLRGAKTAAFGVIPDAAIVIDATTAADLPEVTNEKRVCSLSGGPVISFMDAKTMYDQALYNLTFKTARGLGIPCQPKTLPTGGNDAGAIHLSRTGVRTIAVSLPCRYLHAPVSVIAKSDFDHAIDLIFALAQKIAGGEF